MPRSAARRGTTPRLTLTIGCAAVAFLAILAAFLMPWGPRMIDLDVYRAAARAVLAGGDPYTVSGPEGLPFTYPIFAAFVFIPLAVLPTVAARVAITLVSFAALLLICHLTLRVVLRPLSDRRVALTSIPVAVLAVSAHPVLDTLLFGQVNLVLVAMVLANVLLVTGRGRGILVGLAAGIKLTPGLFLIYFLVTGQRREARTAALTAALTVIAGLIVRPASAWQFLTRYMLDPSRTGNVTYAGNQSILAVTARLLRDATPPPALTWGLSAVVVAAALLIARQLRRTGDELTAVSAVAAAALLASPVSWTHHWVWFIPAVGAVSLWAHQAGGGWRWVPVVVATLVLWSGPMRFTPKNDLRELAHTPAQQLVANSFGLLAVAFLVWAAVRAHAGSGGAGGGGGTGAGAARSGRGGIARRDHVHHEAQRASGRTGGLLGVGERRGDVELNPAAHLHADQALVPALDDLAVPDGEAERLPPVPARVELLAGGVVHPDVLD